MKPFVWKINTTFILACVIYASAIPVLGQIHSSDTSTVNKRELLDDFYSEWCDGADPYICRFNLAVGGKDREIINRLLNEKISPDVKSGEFEFNHIPIVNAALAGDCENITAFAKAGASLEITDKTRGMTPLLWANYLSDIKSNASYYDVTKCLLQNGAFVNAQDNEGYSALMRNAELKRIRYVELFLKNGADVNLRNNSFATALILSADDPTLIELLLKAGAEINAVDSNGDSALAHAVRNCSVEKIRMLLASGADPSIKNDNGFSSIDISHKNRTKCQSGYALLERFRSD